MAASADSEAIRHKWDARYRASHAAAGGIATVLRENRQLLSAPGRALDLACGLGGNALFLAALGFEVHAWDISPVAIDRLTVTAHQRSLTLYPQVRDCLAQPPASESFDLILVSRFLERALCPAISAALKPGGLLFYQTYTQQQEGGAAPSNPHFLLAQGELVELFSELELLVYQEGNEAQFVGRKR